MENQFYKTVPVSEDYIIALGEIPMRNIEGVLTHVLSPVPLTLPEEVDENAVHEEAQKRWPLSNFESMACRGAFSYGGDHVRDTLSPAFSSLQEENERLKKHLNDECLRSGEFKSQSERQAERIKEMEEAVKISRSFVSSCRFAVQESIRKEAQDVLNQLSALTSK